MTLALVGAALAGAALSAGALAQAPAAAPERGTQAATLRAIAIAEDRRHDDGSIARGLESADPVVQTRAALAAGRIQDSTWVVRLLPLLGSPSPDPRREAAFALGQIAHRSARQGLEALAAHPDVESAALAIEALGKLGDRAATPRVVAAIGSHEPRLRAEAGVALWRLADSTALDALLARHDDPDGGVRWSLLYALEKIVQPDRVVLVAALHLEDDEAPIRAQAVRTIGRQKSTRGTAYVLQKLADPDVGVVVNAIRALQQIADSTCAPCGPVLAGALAHPHPYARVTAATALAERFAWVADSTRLPAMREAVWKALDDPDAATRGAAARALLIRGLAWPPAKPLEAALRDSSVVARAAVLRALPHAPAAVAGPILTRAIGLGPLLERMTAAEALGEMKLKAAAGALRAGLADTSGLFVAAAASALGEMGDTASVPALAAARRAHARDADPDVPGALRDALRALGAGSLADSIERALPRPAPASDHPPDFGEPPAERGAILHTDAGDIEWEFYRREAPQTVRNFVRLAERGWFEGTSYHRVVPNFVIQDGDPTGTGSGGPGYSIRCEYNRLRYEPGMVGMALSGKDTGGSQWFVTHSAQPHLNGRYTIFAHVTRGMDVVNRTVQGTVIRHVEILR